MEIVNNRKTFVFNSAIECALRSLVLLEFAFPKTYDLQRLVFYDYLLVHSADAGGPESLHPATPNRAGEVLIKRQLLENGLILLLSRSLVKRIYDEKGITYVASEDSTPFLDNLQSSYTSQLKKRAEWVVSTFSSFSELDLKKFFQQNLDRWGGEFTREAILKYGEL